MSQHEKEIAFLKTLTLYGNCDESRSWRERINSVERDERAVCDAMRLMTWVLVLSLCELGYQNILQPDIFDGLSHLLTKVFSAASLAAAICLVVFAIAWLYLHQISN